jgi:hypothetical protein
MYLENKNKEAKRGCLTIKGIKYKFLYGRTKTE